MYLDEKHIEFIKESWANMLTRNDLLDLLNYVKPQIYGPKTIPFELKQLTWFSNPRVNQRRYLAFNVKKKSGGERSIHAPVKGLKSLQRCLAYVLKHVQEPHKAAMGFVDGRSIVDNARHHEGQNYVYNIDLKDFFPSVDQARVWKCLQLPPFNLIDKSSDDIKVNTGVRKFKTEFNETIYYKVDSNMVSLIRDKNGNYKRYEKRLTAHLAKPVLNAEEGLNVFSKMSDHRKMVTDIVFADAKRYLLTEQNISKLSALGASRLSIANLLASLCCTEMIVQRVTNQGDMVPVLRNVLPQGAPTSPVISNIICQKLDYLLTGVAKRFGLRYTRYADDITFSSMHNVYQDNSDFVKELHRIIKEQGFQLKESKTRLQKEGYRQEVTGLLVNEKVNVQKRYVKQLRLWLYYWERYGYERAYSFFLQQYLAEKGHVKKGKPDMVNVILGKLDYLRMVKGEENTTYKVLRNRVQQLTGKSDRISNVLNIWEQAGLESAMEIYYASKNNYEQKKG